MRTKQSWTFVFSALAFLYFQSIVSVMHFSQTNIDRGAWPFVLAIVSILNLLYSTFVVEMVRRDHALGNHVAWSTILLSILMLFYDNIFVIFPNAAQLLASKSAMVGRLLGSNASPYLVYLFFALIPLFTRRVRP